MFLLLIGLCWEVLNMISDDDDDDVSGFRMMLQHTGLGLGLGLGPTEISASALVPCLSPPGSLTLDDFTHFSPLVKEELRYAIQNKRLSGGMSAASTSCSTYSSEKATELLGARREVRRVCLRCYLRRYLRHLQFDTFEDGSLFHLIVC